MSETAQIKELLQAEKEADQLIEDARARRQERLRQAKVAAEEKAQKYRQELERNAAQEAAAGGDGKDEGVAKIKAALEQETADMLRNFEQNHAQVVDWLKYEATAVTLEVSEALRQSALNLSAADRRV